MKITRLILVAALFLVYACTPTKVIEETIVEAAPTEERDLDTLVITPEPEPVETFELPKYNPSATRTHDLIHTKLDVKFDWSKQHLIGKAWLDLKPYFYATDQLELDAKGFDIHKVALVKGSILQDLKYDYDGRKLKIVLDRVYKADEEYQIHIDYTAKPNELEVGGSAAITQDKGLYFINPLKEDPNKPQQIWTQGETEASSCWFPTIDKPNERTTQEMEITVEDRFVTLSNGDLKKSTKNTDGTRTDYWVMADAHAPYLFMMAIGEFAVIKEQWKGKELGYYVEPEYEKYAKNIFPYTPEMLDFFSEKYGLDYPWSKYSQVVVRDYVSGAMENTTGVIFGEFMQGTDRDLIDVETNEKIVAHEMAHHWFGDYVTCESWANLTLNEGFANYSEYMWMEEKHGRDAADHHWLSELNGYIGSTKRGSVHPLIHYGYNDKEDMFDAHSYNKGGMVLHMLRGIIGDEAFYASLERYLKENAMTDVEGHELRLAVEDITGQDMNWFFDQWFYGAGHPQLNITYGYNADDKKATITIEQNQDPEQMQPIFQAPVAIDVYVNGKPIRHEVWLNERMQTFSFEVADKPQLINFDAHKTLLCEKKENKSEEELIFQYHNAPLFLDRYEALVGLRSSESAAAQNVFKAALKDNFWSLRRMALEFIKIETGDGSIATITEMAANDSRSDVRARAIQKLVELDDAKYASTLKKVLDKELAYGVISEALLGLNELAPADALAYAKKLEAEEKPSIIATITAIYAGTGDLQYLPYFDKVWSKVDGFNSTDFFDSYMILLIQSDESKVKDGINKLAKVGKSDSQSLWRRYAATRSIYNTLEAYRDKAKDADEAMKADLDATITSMSAVLDEVKAAETNGQLKRLYSQWK